MNQTNFFSKIFFLLYALFFIPVPKGYAWSRSTSSSCTQRELQSQKNREEQRAIIQSLYLTPAQHKAIRKLHRFFLKKLEVIQKQQKIERMKLRQELQKSSPNKVQIYKLTVILGQLHCKRLDLMIQARLDLNEKILTPAQLEKLNQEENKLISGK